MKNSKTSAFPFHFENQRNWETHQDGLTKREYAAIKAMQGHLAFSGNSLPKEELAKRCIIIADELLTQLES